MSIFRSTFKPFVIRQLAARQYILSSGDNALSRPIQVQQYTMSKTPWVKMVSFVDYDNPSRKLSGDALAKKYVLSAGTLLPGEKDTYALRAGFGNRKGVYGSNLGNRQLGLRPMPGIESITVESKGTYGSLEEATVKFYAWDKAQLDDLEILFMRPGYPVLLEWGWSQYLDTNDKANADTYDKESDTNSLKITNNDIDRILRVNGYIKSFDQPTINAFDSTKTQEDIYDTIRILKHKFCGNYDGMMGLIRNFSWTKMTNGGYECTTTIVSIGDILGSLKMNRAIDDEEIKNGNPDNGYSNNFSKLLSYLIEDTTDTMENVEADFVGSPYKDMLDFTIIRVTNVDMGNQANQGNRVASTDAKLNYIQFAVLIYIIDKYFSYYVADKQPLTKLEMPLPIPGNYGTGLCLASDDSVSVDPFTCIMKNSRAKFITGLEDGYYPTALKRAGIDMKEFLLKNETLGVIGNLYINIQKVQDIFESLLASNPKQEVSVFDFVKAILDQINVSLGAINDFGIYSTENKICIIDTNYVEPEADTEQSKKYQMNIFGNDTFVRNHNIVSKIFQSQANMIAIAAQDRENVASVQNSTYVYLNKGMKSRIFRSIKEKANANNSDSKQDQDNERLKVAKSVADMRVYLKNFLDPSDKKMKIPAINTATFNSSTDLNSIINRVNFDTNYRAIIPISLDITIDGISGIFPNQIFRVNPDTLPDEWNNKSVGFIVTKVRHAINRSDWTTNIETQTCLLNQSKLRGYAKEGSKNIEEQKQDLNNLINGLVIDSIAKQNKAIDGYTSLLEFIKLYVENKISVNGKLGIKNYYTYNEGKSIATSVSKTDYTSFSNIKLTKDGSIAEASSIIGELNLLNLDMMFKSVSPYNTIEKNIGAYVRNPSIIGQRIQQHFTNQKNTDANPPQDTFIDVDFLIQAPFSGGANMTLYNLTGSQNLLKNILVSLNEYKMLPDELRAKLDKVVVDLYNTKSTTYQAYGVKGLFDSNGQLIGVSNDPNTKISITLQSKPISIPDSKNKIL